MKQAAADLRRVVVTDCGSTTTKARLFERGPQGWFERCQGEAPTTVEAPVADVTVGALNAFAELEELWGHALLNPNWSRHSGLQHPFIVSDAAGADGVDLYLSTSSAGGGLQMLVTGVAKTISAESAQRAALGAGAIVMDALAFDDGRNDVERIERIRHIRPDIVLLAGGIEGGASRHVVELAEMIVAADPRPRFGETLRLPIIGAANSAATDAVRAVVGDRAQLTFVANVRPGFDREDLGPAREAIHELFLSHVMSHSPGYGTLLQWSPQPIIPTPAAVGTMIERYAQRTKQNVLCADIGGATTDVFSVFRGTSGAPIFHRTVSANLGMSYSVAHVLVEAGSANIKRWLPFCLSDSELRDRLRNKMIRPTSIPHTSEDLWLEQAVCREALRLSFAHHRSLARDVSESTASRGIADLFRRSARFELVDRMALDVVIGSGGVLSHAPQRLAAALMMLDGFALEGITQIMVDSVFMLPHLGVLAEVHPQAAEEILQASCLVNIAHAIVPIGPASQQVRARVNFNGALVGEVRAGQVGLVSQLANQAGMLRVEPTARGIDCGAGPGRPVERAVSLGSSGLILDGRLRPIKHALNESEQARAQAALLAGLGCLSSESGGSE